MHKKISGVYFSATNNTKDIVNRILRELSINLEIEIRNSYDFTLPCARKKILNFDENDIVVLGVPVYAGRVPNLLLKYLKSIVGGGALCIAVVTFGNRNFDDALLELATIMEKDGFNVVSAAAFVYPHSFSKILAYDRPDEGDKLSIVKFSEFTALNIKKIDDSQLNNVSYKTEKNDEIFSISSILGESPCRDYYKPVDNNGDVFEFRKIKPHTFKNCIKCNICVDLCPMASIGKDDPKIVSGKCIKCCACIKSCPVRAKEFIDENYIKHKLELEELMHIRQESYICY